MDQLQTPISGPELGPSIPIAPRKHGWGIVIKIIVSMVIAAIIVGGVFLVIRIWKPSPEKVIREALTKIEEVNTLHYSVKGDIEPIADFRISIDFNSDLDKTNLEVPKTAGYFNIIMSSEDEQLRLTGEYKNIGETSFLKLDNLKSNHVFAFLFLFGLDFSKLTDNQWIKIEQPNKSKSASGDTYAQELEEKIQSQKEIMKILKNQLKDKELYAVKKELADEKIGDIKTYHYLVALNQEKVKEIIDLLEVSENITNLIGARLKDKIATVQADIYGMRATIEMIWWDEGENYSKVNCQHREIKEVCNNIERYTGMKPVIFAGTDEYCAYASLPLEGYYVCIDSLGTATTTNIFPEESGYCNGKTFICPKRTWAETSIPEKDIKKAVEGEFLKRVEKIGETPSEIWIGKEDNYLYKVKLGGEDNDFIKLEIEFSNFNKPVNIKEPADYKSLEEILAEQKIFEGSEEQDNEVPEEPKDKKYIDMAIKADLSSLRAAAELYAWNENNESYLGFCTNRDALRADQVIADNGSKMYCADTVNTWIACAQLKEIPTDSYCVDWKGNAKQLINTICNSSFVDDNTTCP